MKHLIILSSVFFLLSACNNGKNNKAPEQDLSFLEKTARDTSNYTEIQLIDSLANFGEVTEGEKVEVTFKFKNIGDKNLYLTEVHAGCGCTTPDYSKEAIAPGKEGWVKGVFNSKNQHGEVHKYINIRTNTKNGTERRLMFTGTVKPANP